MRHAIQFRFICSQANHRSIAHIAAVSSMIAQNRGSKDIQPFARCSAATVQCVVPSIGDENDDALPWFEDSDDFGAEFAADTHFELPIGTEAAEASSETESAELTMEERIDIAELDIDFWPPMQLYKKGGLGEFIWDVLIQNPESFYGQMGALMSSGREMSRRLIYLGSECQPTEREEHLRSTRLALEVQMIVAYVKVREDMVAGGLVKRYPGIMEWESR